jgi:uncharacterized protein
MSMRRILNLAGLIGVCGSVEGRKKLQKIVHILQEIGFAEDFPHKFGYLHYGPYSPSLRSDIDELVSERWGFVQEVTQQAGQYSQYSYSLQDGVAEDLDELIALSEAKWAPRAADLAAKSAQDLETISTIMYLQRSGFDGKVLEDRFKELKPALADRFASGLDEVVRLRNRGN